MEILFTIAAFLILVGIVVTIHEGGHFITAVLCRIKVLEFSIGFGPKIFSKNLNIKGDQVLFTLRALPLGGFVKPLDQSALTAEEWEKMPEEEKSRSFANAKKWKKALMVFGGPFSNFVLAFILFLIAFSFVGTKGLPATVGEIVPNSPFVSSGLKIGDVIEKIDNKKITFSNDAHAYIANAAINGDKINILTSDQRNHIVDLSTVNLKELDDDISALTGLYFQGKIGTVVVDEIIPNSGAQKADLKAGDKIIALEGQEIKDLNKFMRRIKYFEKENITLTIERDGQLIEKTVIPEKTVQKNGKTTNIIGIMWEVPSSNLTTVHLGFTESAVQSFERVASSTWTTLVSIKKLVTAELSSKALSGPLSIADYSGKSAKHGLYTYLIMMAAISIAVGVFNLLPIPMLDGGHLLQYFIESIRNKDFTMSQQENFQYIGIATMTGIFVFAIINDINKYFSIF